MMLSILYPLAIYFGLQNTEARYLVFILLGAGIVRALTLGRTPLNHWVWLPLLFVLTLWTWVNNNAMTLKLYPVFMNASFFLLFSWSLFTPPSIIERIARLTNPELPEQAIAYTYKVTIIWCCFFIINGSISLSLTLFASDKAWVLYNGLISYILMGLLFSVEWIVRQKVIKKNHG